MRYVSAFLMLIFLLPSSASAYRCTGPRSEPPNYVSARIEAERGNAIAQFILGQFYDTHRTTSSIFATKSDSEAVKWYLKSANQGYSEAQQRVASFAGIGGNYEEAFFWWSLGGHAEMARELARDHLSTEQVAAINKRIDEWQPTTVVPPPMTPELLALKEKAEAGDTLAQVELGDAFANLPRNLRRCDETERIDDPIFRNRTEAKKWYRMAAATKGNAAAQNKLARQYANQRNYPEAIKWFRMAAGQGDREAAWQLSAIYKGNPGAVSTGQPPNYEEAYFWLLVAGNLGGRGPISDWQKPLIEHLSPEQISAVKLRIQEWKPHPNSASIKAPSPSDIALQKLAESGSPRAQYELGMQYDAGQLANVAEAERWYLASAHNGFAQGQYFLARLYEGQEKYLETEKWYRMAAEQGHNAAQVELSNLFRRNDLPQIKQNLEEAYFWISVATVNNQQYSRSRDKTGEQLTPEQRAAIDKRVAEWKPNPSPETAAFQKQ